MKKLQIKTPRHLIKKVKYILENIANYDINLNGINKFVTVVEWEDSRVDCSHKSKKIDGWERLNLLTTLNLWANDPRLEIHMATSERHVREKISQEISNFGYANYILITGKD